MKISYDKTETQTRGQIQSKSKLQFMLFFFYICSLILLTYNKLLNFVAQTDPSISS